MKRIGFQLKVQPDKIAEYRARHQAVWPEMLDALRRSGWHNYSIFMRPDGLLFGYVEVDDTFAEAEARMAREDANERWQTYMNGFFEIPQDIHADQAMLELTEVFHLD